MVISLNMYMANQKDCMMNDDGLEKLFNRINASVRNQLPTHLLWTHKLSYKEAM